MKQKHVLRLSIIAEFPNGMTLEIPWDGRQDRGMVFRRECKRLRIEPLAVLY